MYLTFINENKIIFKTNYIMILISNLNLQTKGKNMAVRGLDKVEFDEALLTINKNGETATVTYGNEKHFVETSGLEEEAVAKVFKHTASYITSATEAAAKYATEQFKTDPELKTIDFIYPYGTSGKDGSVNVHVGKEKTFPNRFTGETVTGPDITTKVQHTSYKVSKTFIKNLKSDMMEQLA